MSAMYSPRKWSLTIRAAFATRRRPKVRLAARNRASPPTGPADAADVDCALPAIPRIAAMMIQPSKSSTVEEATEDLAEVASFEVHVAQYARDDLDRGDRQRDAEKSAVANRCLSSGIGVEGSIRPSAAPREERNRDPGQGDAQGRPAQPLHEPQDSPCRSRRAGGGCRTPQTHGGRPCRPGREENRVCSRCGETAPRREGAEQNARDKLPEHWRLAKTLDRLPEEARREQNDDDRDQKAGLEGHCDSLRAGDASSRPVRAICSVRRPRSDFAPDERESPRQ